MALLPVVMAALAQRNTAANGHFCMAGWSYGWRAPDKKHYADAMLKPGFI
jgi:hypothetical protein